MTLCFLLLAVEGSQAQSSAKSKGFSQLDFDSGDGDGSGKEGDSVDEEEPIFRERVRRSMGIKKEEKKPLTLDQERWSEVKGRGLTKSEEEGKTTIRVLNTEDLIKEAESAAEPEAQK